MEISLKVSACIEILLRALIFTLRENRDVFNIDGIALFDGARIKIGPICIRFKMRKSFHARMSVASIGAFAVFIFPILLSYSAVRNIIYRDVY